MSSTNLVVEAWTCWAIAVVFIAVRIAVRLRQVGWRQLQLDDGLMLCALVRHLYRMHAARTLNCGSNIQ